MSADKEKIIDRIRKLIALSGSSNEHEAALAAEKAQVLLAEHNLATADIKADDNEDEEFEIEEVAETDSYPWRRQLGAMVSQLYFCKYFFTTTGQTEKRRDIHTFVGATHNIAVAKIMFTYLFSTVDRLAREGAKSYPVKEQSPYRTSFRHACSLRLCHRIAQRIQQGKSGQLKTEAGTNLPALLSLYEQAEAKAGATIAAKVGKMIVKKARITLNHSGGIRDGNEAGHKIGLDNQIGKQNAGNLLGRQA